MEEKEKFAMQAGRQPGLTGPGTTTSITGLEKGKIKGINPFN